MKVMSTYKVRLGKELCFPLQPTLDKYRSAVAFFVDVMLSEWDSYSEIKYGNDSVKISEELTVRNRNRTDPKYPFDVYFYKFPSYLRRAAIMEAYGKVSSYKTNLTKWESETKEVRGKKPSLPTISDCFPAMYRDNCFVRTGTYTARIKVWIHNTWDWLDVTLRKTDVDYIRSHCGLRKECVPTLSKRGKNWSLDFAFEQTVKLPETKADKRRIVSVDLGINNAATCSVMESDGTVVARRFLSLRTENDCLRHVLNMIKRAQQSGARNMPSLWAKANGINRNISECTASFIVDTAVMYECDVVVMEYLDMSGKKRGSKKQCLHHWKVKRVQAIVTHKCHTNGIHMATVCARNTSRLAFDGSGIVLRGKESKKIKGSYSVCEFQNGKIYNCDLNASYNIGARYFIREILGSMPERARSSMEAKVPSLAKRSTCTLSDLKGLRAAMVSLGSPLVERVMSGKTRESDAPQGQPPVGGSRKHATLVV
jgi:IS605 OrfB family transposase